MIVIALVLFLIGMLIWKKCFSPSQSMEASPSSTFGSTYAGSQSTSHSPRSTGDQ
jgi:hypothetical protein